MSQLYFPGGKAEKLALFHVSKPGTQPFAVCMCLCKVEVLHVMFSYAVSGDKVLAKGAQWTVCPRPYVA
jgi:hypothetical protein